MESLLNNVFFLTFAAWPGVVIGCALLNMACQRAFSWSELVMDYLGGVLIGLCFYFGTDPRAHGAAQFFLVFSQGLFGLLHVLDMEALQDRDILFYVSAGSLSGAVVVAGLLDWATTAVSSKAGRAVLSIPIALLKLPFSLCHTAVGLLLFLAGVVWYAICKAREDRTKPDTLNRCGIGFAGGVPYVEWSPKSGEWATTIGSTFMVWQGPVDKVLKHELYHTRQCMYLHDWMIPVYVAFAGPWGMASAAIAKKPTILDWYFRASKSEEVGNPLERAAYASE